MPGMLTSGQLVSNFAKKIPMRSVNLPISAKCLITETFKSVLRKLQFLCEWFAFGPPTHEAIHFACSAARSGCRLHYYSSLSSIFNSLAFRFIPFSFSFLFEKIPKLSKLQYYRETWKEHAPSDHCSWTYAPVLHPSSSCADFPKDQQ